MSQSEHLCKAILEQGVNKGKQCSRPKLLNNYCGKHQTQAGLSVALQNGERKCARTRCTTTFTPVTGKKLEYCAQCTKENEEALTTKTKCKWAEKPCTQTAKESGFCGKHEPRALLLKDASEKGVRICDDGKRACKNETLDKKLKCEECLKKNRERDNTQYAERVEECRCLGCGKEIDDFLTGKRDNMVQRCEECYAKLRKTEEARGDRERNYLAEKRDNLDSYFSSYTKSAKIRNISFELSREEFEALVVKACRYCGESKEGEATGVDRMDSAKGYTTENCVPCCKTCNFMKGTLSMQTFIQNAHKIAAHYPLESLLPIVTEPPKELSSMIPPAKVADMYRNGKFDDYIEACVRDKRSPLFIERLRTLDRGVLTYLEFKKFFRTCCKNDSKLTNNCIHDVRKRIATNEIYGYFNNNNHVDFINIYTGIHGRMGGLKEEAGALAVSWPKLSKEDRNDKIKKILVKYRNQRAQNRVKEDVTTNEVFAPDDTFAQDDTFTQDDVFIPDGGFIPHDLSAQDDTFTPA